MSDAITVASAVEKRPRPYNNTNVGWAVKISQQEIGMDTKAMMRIAFKMLSFISFRFLAAACWDTNGREVVMSPPSRTPDTASMMRVAYLKTDNFPPPNIEVRKFSINVLLSVSAWPPRGYPNILKVFHTRGSPNPQRTR